MRILTILDEYTRECHVLRADRALRAKDFMEWLQKAIQEQGAPAYLRSDNGPEFIANIVQGWLKENEVRTLCIEPGSPWQNGLLGDGLACGVFLGARVCHRPVEREACEESIRTRLR